MSSYTTLAARWQAVRTRDALAASDFVYCVKTTGIFCRPTCSARLARRSNVEFHDTPELAKQAGYRACKRCRPELKTWDPAEDVVTAACASINNRIAGGEKVALDDLAAVSGLSKWHFHRVFKKITGFTPKEWADRAKRDLQVSKATGAGGERAGVSPTQPSNMTTDDSFDPFPISNQTGELEVANAWDEEFFRNMNNTEVNPMESPTDDMESQFGMSTETSLGTPATPATPCDSNLHDPMAVPSGDWTKTLPIFYTIRCTTFGMILIGFRAGEIRVLKMGDTESELENELHTEYPRPSTYRFAPQTYNGHVTTEENDFENHVSTILDALERPSGKTINVPMNLRGSF